MEDDKYKIPLFNGNNFSNWKFRIEVFLEEKDLKECLEERKDIYNVTSEMQEEDKKVAEALLKERIRKEKQCKSIIIQRIADSHLEYVKDKKTPCEIWSTLVNIFERKGISSQLLLRKKLLSMKVEENDSMENHLLKFDKLIRDLKSAGTKMEETDVICHLFLTLPKCYDTIVTALETIPDRKLTLDFVKSRLLEEEIKRRNTGTIKKNETKAIAFTANKFPFKCYKCDRIGHKKADCKFKKDKDRNGKSFFPKERKTERKEEKSEVSIAFIATDKKKEEEADTMNWYLDSGASDHMCNNIKHFKILKKLDKPVNISVAKSNVSLTAEYIGNIDATMKIGGIDTCIEIKDVLFVSNLNYNLLSVRRLEMSGKKVVIENGYVNIVFGNNNVCIAKREGKMYIVKMKWKTEEAQQAITITDNTSLWHRRLGHVNYKTLYEMKQKGVVEGIEGTLEKNGQVCESCIAGKQTRLPHKQQRPKTKRVLELIHSDVCGPISPTTWDDKKYFLTLIDDYTHFTVIYLLETKSEVTKYFKEYEALVTAQFSSKISKLRCDNGTEYTTKDLTGFCKSKGIQVVYTTPYTPELNGVAERMNRTIVETARSMLVGTQLGKSFWGEAVRAAVYILNRRLTSATAVQKTPAELWHGKKPNLTNIKTFGCLAYIHIPKQFRNKFDSKTKKCQMIGYSPTGYRLWDPIKKKIISGYDIVFDENYFIFEREAPDMYIPNIETTREITDTEEEEEKPNDSCHEEVESEVEDNTTDLLETQKRKRNPPKYLEDYDTTYFAMNVESYVENLPQTLEECQMRPDSNHWKEAIESEMESLIKNDTWTLVRRPENAKIISCRWLFKVKRDENGDILKYKARLVARGFEQEKGLDYEETYAPVAKMKTLRLLLAVGNKHKYFFHQMDVRTAFLNGILKETVYMEQPKGFETANMVCKLNRALYGLKQSPRCWYERLNNFLIQNEFSRSNSDHCLYIKGNHIEKSMFLLVFVDDMIIACRHEEEIIFIKNKLKKEFDMQDMGELKYFLGLKITQKRECETLEISQRKYIIDVLQKFGMLDCKPISTPMEPALNITIENEDKGLETIHRQLIGCLLYATMCSRPDICYAVTYLSRFQHKPNTETWTYMKRVLRYLKGTLDQKLTYDRNISENALYGYVDADWGSDKQDRKSTTGYVYYIYGCLCVWSSKKQGSVSLSSTEAEYVALSEACTEVIWIKRILQEMGLKISNAIEIFEDNQSCINLTKNAVLHKRTKHIDIRHNFVRDLVEEKEVIVKYIQSEHQVADLMTKALSRSRFEKLVGKLGLH